MSERVATSTQALGDGEHAQAEVEAAPAERLKTGALSSGLTRNDDAGRAIRRSTARAHQRTARRLSRLAAKATGERAAALRAQALQHFYRAVLAGSAHRLPELLKASSSAASTAALLPQLPVDTSIPTPTGLTANPGDRQVTLQWNNMTGLLPAGATMVGYQIVYTALGGLPATLPNTAPTTLTQVVGLPAAPPLTNGVTYAFSVATVANLVTGQAVSLPAVISATPVAASVVVNAPTGLSAAPGDRSVRLTWNDITAALPPGATLTGYQVSYQPLGGSSAMLPTVGPTATPSTTVGSPATPALSNGQPYSFSVAALATAAGNAIIGAPAVVVAMPLAPTSAIPAPAGLTATPGDRKVDLTWTDVSALLPSGAVFAGYRVSYLTPGQVPTTLPIATTAAATAGPPTSPPLINGQAYTFSVVTLATAAGSQASSLPAVIGATPVSPLAVFAPSLPTFSHDPLRLFDSALSNDVVAASRMVAEADAAASKWRYEHLRDTALSAVRAAADYDRELISLMSMAVAKSAAAEELLNPVLVPILQQLQGGVQSLTQLDASQEVQGRIAELAGKAATALVLEALILWLSENDAFTFWRGLFDALIGDVAAFDFSLSRTSAFILSAYTSAPLGTAISDAAKALEQRVEAEVDHVAAPLRSAVAQLIGGTSSKMKAVFESFDLPILERPGGLGDQPDVSPFDTLFSQLSNAVDSLVDDIQNQLRNTLQGIAAGAAQQLLVSLVIAYIVLPLLSVLAVAIAGGPFAAALLAGVVAVAWEELAHLIALWLRGPLLDQVARAKEDAAQVIERLQDAFSRAASMFDASTPVNQLLPLLGNELAELRDLLPQAFLTEAANLIGDARDQLMAAAVAPALAAERALGLENATAFDVVSHSYAHQITPAGQLPGGSSPGLFAGVALARDLARLEGERTRLQGGKEAEFTRRLSLFRLLGGTGDPTTAAGTALGQFALFQQTGTCVVHLRESDLLDQSQPGLYRALVKEVSVKGVLSAPISDGLPLPGGVPVTVTHLGESRTRVKKQDNPQAPPTVLPACLGDKNAFLNKVVDLSLIGSFTDAATDPARKQSSSFQSACVDYVPGAIRQLVIDTCPFVDADAVASACRTMLLDVSWAPVHNRADAHNFVILMLWFFSFGPLVTASSAAFDAARERELERIAKWGAVSFEEDPDPNLRALGFVNMVRRGERESAVFDLFPGTSPVELRLLSPALAPGGEQRDREAESIQYRPFENVGLEGRLVLSVPAAYAASLTDVVLEVRGRALFDSDLAATVSAGRQQSAEQMGLVQAIAGQAYGKALVTSQPDLASGATELRSVQWSLRAERDRSLEAILALAQAKVGSTNLGPPGTSITVGTPASSVTFTVGNAVPLQTGQAFTHFTNQPPGGITFQLAGAAPSQVTDLIGKITVTPDQLGLRTSGLPLNLDADPQAHPRLVGMAVAVVPWTAAPIQLKVQAITAPFTTLLGWSVGTVVSQAITMTRFAADEDIAAAIKNGAQLVLAPVDGPLGPFYDVIFSLSFRLPALEAGTVSATSS